ncbi:uncharacterized protein LOC105841518 [Bombyx mori]|uniref:uncharacterized protein LOC105841518 n=1 Tax=Bombyx mori TaxID=7091 RepID=UPI002ED05740
MFAEPQSPDKTMSTTIPTFAYERATHGSNYSQGQRSQRYRAGRETNKENGHRPEAERTTSEAGRGRRGGAPLALSPPRGRVRAVVARHSLRRAGVSPRVQAGGGEPRAARPRADVARSRSAPAPRRPPPPRRRARSLAARPPAPRLRPVFLWARQRDGTVQEVHCEDYDPRNRIRIARTPAGWRVIPRTEIYNSIRIPPVQPRDRKERRRRRRSDGPRRRRPAVPEPAPAWLPPDLESHIPSHTIAVPRQQVPEPTPLDNLLAVAELEFNQQRGEEALGLDLQAAVPAHPPAAPSYSFLQSEEVARDVMSFDLSASKPPEAMYYERKAQAQNCTEDSAYGGDMSVHKDLFDTISEAHYLPELGGPHDEALLDSLVEKGCEDNQILGQTLDKLAHLVHGAAEYAESEEDMLLNNGPVSDIIDRLEHSLESPSRSSITAAQGLLHLHHIGDHHLTQPEHQSSVESYMSDEVFVAEPSSDCGLQALSEASVMQATNNVNHYTDPIEKSIHDDVASSDTMYSEQVSDLQESYESEKRYVEPQGSIPDQSDDTSTEDEPKDATSQNKDEDCQTDGELDSKIEEPDIDDQPPDDEPILNLAQELSQASTNDENSPTDLSVKHVDKDIPKVVARAAETTHAIEDNLSDKSDEQPKDLSVHRRMATPHASPRRIEIPRAPSRESDAMQSPQPSGIPAVPSSPEIFTMPVTKSKQALFLETLLSSPSPKMYTSEVTITKQQCEPLNLGKHRKSASPTVSSCSDEIRKINKEFGEPQEKRIKRESTEDLAKINKVFNKCGEVKPKKIEWPAFNFDDDPIKQLQTLKSNADYNVPDPMLIPKDKLNLILASPGKEIMNLLSSRPELQLPEAFAFPAVLQDPDVLVISLSQLETILENQNKGKTSPKPKDPKPASKPTPVAEPPTTPCTEPSTTPQPDQQTSHPKPIPSMDALAGDIDAATSAALNHMLWLPYLTQLEAVANCSQSLNFLKALNSSGYNPSNYAELTQMFNPASRFMGPSGFPMMPPMDYDNRLQFAMWQEAMNHANSAQRSGGKTNSTPDTQMKDVTTKSNDVQNPYVHSTKNYQNKTHSAARTSPIAHNYNHGQRSMPQNPYLQNMYAGMNPNIRPNVPLPGLQIPYFNPNMMGSQRSPRTTQQKSPTSPYYPNNNYLSSTKQAEGQSTRSSSSSSQESPRPRITVKSLHNLMEPMVAAAAATASGAGATSRRSSNTPAALGRRREEPEVGSTTPLGEPQPHIPPHPHDPSSFHLWHPLFGNQKSYNSPWNWTTVTATGD